MGESLRFTAWQIEMLRRGIQAYRVHKARNGRLMPWKIVLADMGELQATSAQGTGADLDMNLKEEALRRFASGESVLEPVKLGDVRRFLEHTGILAKEELAAASGEDAEATVVRRFLANDSLVSRAVLRRFASNYKVEDNPGQAIEQVELSLALNPSGTFVIAEERYCRDVGRGHAPVPDGGIWKQFGFDACINEPLRAGDPSGDSAGEAVSMGLVAEPDALTEGPALAFDPSAPSAEDWERSRRQFAARRSDRRSRPADQIAFDSIRRGYGFVSTPADVLHLFLRGYAARDRIHYFQVAGAGGLAQIALLRLGAPPAGKAGQERQSLTMQDFGIYRFQAVDSPWSS